MAYSLRNRGWIAAAGVYVAVVVAASTWLDYDPYLAILFSVAAILVGVALYRWPALIFACVLFVGSFKTQAVTEITLRDPSILCLALAAVAALVAIPAWRLLSLGELFSGQSGAILAFCLFLFIITMSYSYTLAPGVGGQKLLKVGIIDSFLFISPMLVFKREKHVKQFIVAVAVLSVMLTVRLLVGVFAPSVLPLLPARPGEFATQLGAGQLLGLTILLLFFSKQTERWPKLVTWGAALTCGAGLIASAARGPVFSTLLALVIGAFLVRPILGSKKIVLATAILGIGAFAGMALIVEQLPSARETFSRKESELTLLFSGETPGGTAGQRLDMFRAAADAFTEKPILGWGIGSWGVYYRGIESPPDWPHNIFLDVLVEEGLAGMSAFLLLVVVITLKIRELVQSGSRFDFLATVCLYCLLISMPSNDIDSRVLWFWVGAVLAASRITKMTARENKVTISPWNPRTVAAIARTAAVGGQNSR